MTYPTSPSELLRPARFGLLMALLAVVFGFGMGALFGAAEDSLKGDLKARAQAVLQTAYAGDETKMQATVDKSWNYYQRAHLHGGAIGVTALGCILLMGFMQRPGRWAKALTSAALGLGALGYSVYWLLAGYLAPGLGSTGAAKESLQWLAVPASGAAIVGLVAVLALAVWEWMGRREVA